MANFRAIFLLMVLVPVLRATAPGVMIQVNQNGINKFLAVGCGILDNTIPGTRIPDTNGKSAPDSNSGPEAKSLFSWELSNIVIAQFHIDQNHAGVALHPTDNVGVSITNLVAEITADYHIKVGSGWLSVSKSGSLTASTNDASASISVDVTTSSDGHPALSPHSCGSDLGDLGIEFHGDLIDDIIDLFKKYISDYVKGKVEGIICDQVSSIIANEGNSFLRQVPISIALPDPMTGFDLDYGLTENPIATDSYIAVPLKAKFWYQGHENDAGIPQASGTIAPAQNSQDLCLNFDADEIFGSAAYALQVSPLSHLTIDQNVLGTFGSAIQHFMQCHCSDNLCIGAIIPAIGAACPEGGVVDVSAQATDVVTFTFNSTGAFGDLKATAGFQSHFPNGEMHDLFHITTTVDLEVPSNLRFEGWMIKGQVLVTGADLQLGSSLIGDIDSAAIQQIWDTVLKIVVETSISHLLEAGIPLPQLPYVNVVNPNIWFAPHALTFCTDAQYTG